MSFSDDVDLDAGLWRGAVRETAWLREKKEARSCSVLLLGEDNPQSSREEYQLYNRPDGCAGHRLQAHLGLDDDAYLALWRTNLCCPRWSLRSAHERAAVLLARDSPWELIVCLGRKVADVMVRHTTTALVRPDFVPFETRVAARLPRSPDESVPTPIVRLLSIPHPSGRSRAWNNPDARVRAREMLREMAPEISWGQS